MQGSVADQDPAALDLFVDLKLGKLRFVFLGYFVAHLQVFRRFCWVYIIPNFDIWYILLFQLLREMCSHSPSIIGTGTGLKSS